jgi:TetR/AcrR family transcriptional repressor of nem operon
VLRLVRSGRHGCFQLQVMSLCVLSWLLRVFEVLCESGVGGCGRRGENLILTTYPLVGIVLSTMGPTYMIDTRHESKTKFLNAATHVIRVKGYTATRIEDVCAEAGLTKGSFFHHFKSKEDLALAAAEHWEEVTSSLFRSAPYRQLADPLDRVLAYVDFRKEILRGELADYTCLVGTMVQEVYDTNPDIREACNRSISSHAATVEADIAEAIKKYGVEGEWTGQSLALYTQATLQGAFILAKAKGGSEIAVDCIDHLHRYIEMLFSQSDPRSVRNDRSTTARR